MKHLKQDGLHLNHLFFSKGDGGSVGSVRHEPMNREIEEALAGDIRTDELEIC
jgi:hypothetical protein